MLIFNKCFASTFFKLLNVRLCVFFNLHNKIYFLSLVYKYYYSIY